MADSRKESDEILLLATQLAREAGAIQRQRYETELQIDTKSESIDLVTDVDRECEALIVESLRRAQPDDAILAEEGTGHSIDGARRRWIVDPLDGTTNYAHGYPRFCVSIGVEEGGRPEVGVVYDPLLEELYHAVRGGGAFLNGRRLRVSQESQLEKALVATGFAYDVRKNRQDNVAEFGRFIKAARAVRRDGSAALDLCYVAAGRLDGYWEFALHAWDVAAGFLIVEEAGGRCSDFHGGPARRSGEETLASNGLVHEAMLAILQA
ncbi:MAG: inositol monophosphatase family protein [Myxococcota bacterium]